MRRSLALNVSIPRLLFEAATSPTPAETPTARRAQLAELFRAHRTLASLGNNVNQMARALNADPSSAHGLKGEVQHTLIAVRAASMNLDRAIDGLGL